MIRNSRAVAAAAIAGTLTLVPAVSACGAGFSPQSALPTQLTEGVNISVPDMKIRNLFVLGPDLGRTLAPGSSVPLYGVLLNTTGNPDRLVGMSAPGLAQSSRLPAGGVELPPGRLVSLDEVPGTQVGPAVVLQGIIGGQRGGEWIDLALRFQRAGVVRTQVPIVPRSGYYLTYSPVPTRSPSATPGTEGPQPSGTATARPKKTTRTPAATATPTG